MQTDYWHRAIEKLNPSVVIVRGDTAYDIDNNIVDYDVEAAKAEAAHMEYKASLPQQVPMWAVRTVLQNNGRFDEINAIIAGSTDNSLKNVWEYGNFADRNSTAINTIAYTLGLTEQQVDQMFIDADSLSV